MTAAIHPHPSTPRWGRFVALAFAALAAASLLDWSAALPGGVADATSARGTSDPATAATMDMDEGIGQKFYTEKTMAPAQELPAQF